MTLIVTFSPSLKRSTGPGDAPCRAVGLGRGCVPRGHLLSLVERHVPETTPIVLRGEAIEEQRAWLTDGTASSGG